MNEMLKLHDNSGPKSPSPTSPTLQALCSMGFLAVATPIPWNESLEHLKHVRSEGIKQFIHL